MVQSVRMFWTAVAKAVVTATSRGGGSNPGPRSPYRAVIFDMGGVVVKYREPDVYMSLLHLAAVNDAFKRDFIAYEEGRMDFNSVKHNISKNPELAILENLDEPEVFRRMMGEKNPIVESALKALRPAGYRLALCTNNGFMIRERSNISILDHSLVSLFDVVVESCRVGVRKPNRKIYQMTADKLGVTCEECVFIDDLEDNCAAAEAVGMKALLFEESNSARSIAALGKLLNMEELLMISTAYITPKTVGFKKGGIGGGDAVIPKYSPSPFSSQAPPPTPTPQSSSSSSLFDGLKTRIMAWRSHSPLESSSSSTKHIEKGSSP